ncbi:MAG TPA: efflux RND transporter periplasmic adaptor subunit, partial [Elusimicrobiales bacterium]|nr:efflux RND transporter periplasmic adaptor subunit [Elusimicrobiales bacterium]
MKKLFKPAVWTVVLALIGAGAVQGYKRYKRMSVRQDLQDFLRTVSKGDLKLELEESGELVSRDTVDVFAPGRGFIVEVLKKEGQYAEKGEKIMMFKGGERMDSTQYVPVPITAPSSGLLTRCVSRYGGSDPEIRAGKRVDGASTCITRVVDMGALAVNLMISEMDIFKLKVGMTVGITFTSIPGEKFTGRIDVIAPMAESKSSNWGSSGAKVFRVVINIDKPIQKMRVGMSAVVTADIEAKKNVLKAPIETLFQEGLNYYV